MAKRLLALILCALLLVPAIAGCGEVAGEIVGNVADAAKKELELQIKRTFEEYKVDILELKTAVGKLNGTSGDIQFFCAVLVRSDNEALPKSCADSLSKLFHDAGVMKQSGSKIQSEYLEHKELSFKFSDFDEKEDYYVVYAYTDKLPSLIPSQTTSGVG